MKVQEAKAKTKTNGHSIYAGNWENGELVGIKKKRKDGIRNGF